MIFRNFCFPYKSVLSRCICDYLHFNTWSQKLKTDQKSFGWQFIKNGCLQSGRGTLKLTVSQKWTVGIKGFSHVGINSGKLKVDLMIFGWAWSKMVMAS